MKPSPALLAVTALTLVGLGLRVAMFGTGWAPDELELLYNNRFWYIPTDAESGVNPPLLRFLVNMLVPDAWVLHAGRAISIVLSTLTIPAMYVLGRRLDDSAIAGLVAAAIVTLHPRAWEMGAQFRAYAAFCFVLTLHADALIRWVRLPSDRVAERQLIVTAMILPWLHYFSIPLFAALAGLHLLVPGARGLWWRYVPAAVGILPMAPVVLGVTEARVGVPGSWSHALAVIFSTTLEVHGSWSSSSGGGDAPHWVMAAGLWAPVAAHVMALPWLERGRRTLTLGVLASVAAVAALLPVQYPRSPISLYFLMWLAPLLGGLASLPRPPVARVALGAGILALLAAPMQGGIPGDGYPEDGAKWWHAHWHELDEVRAGRDIVVAPGFAMVMAHYYAFRVPIGGPGAFEHDCDGVTCFTLDGATWRMPRQKPERNAIVVMYDDPDNEELLAGCTRIVEKVGFAVADCPP